MPGHTAGAHDDFSIFLRGKLEDLRLDIESEYLRFVDERFLALSAEGPSRPAEFVNQSNTPRSDAHDLTSSTLPLSPSEMHADAFKTPNLANHNRFLSAGLTVTERRMIQDITASGGLSTNSHKKFSNGQNSWRARLDRWGEWMVSFITILNCFTIGIGVDHWPTWVGWHIIDGCFLFVFFIYMIIVIHHVGGAQVYFLGTSRKCDLLSDVDLRWRWIEFLLIVSGFGELLASAFSAPLGDMPPISVLRLLRLTRVTRLLRLLKLNAFNELSMMINGAIGGMRTLLWSIVMIGLPIYALALFMRLAIEASPSGYEEGGELFSTLPSAAFTIFRCFVAGDCSTDQGKPLFLLVSQHYGTRYAFIYFSGTVFMVFGISNVIAAIFVENTLQAARLNERHEKRARLLDSHLFTQEITELVRYVAESYAASKFPTQLSFAAGVEERALFNDHGGLDFDVAMQILITPEFMQHLCEEPRFSKMLDKLDIADEDQVDLFGTLDVDGNGAIDLQELITALRKLRGHSRKSDIVEVALIVRTTQLQILRFADQMAGSVDQIQHALNALRLHMPNLDNQGGRATSSCIDHV